MIKKGIHLKLDLETHKMLEKILFAEADKFNYLEKRRKEELAADIVKIGIAEFIRLHELEIRL